MFTLNKSGFLKSEYGSGKSRGEMRAILEALSRSQAVIEFKPDGTILYANKNFCNALGYDLEEIQGKHHSMFVETSYTKTQEYKDFWDRLARGEFFVAEFKRITKDGSEIFIEASYNPVMDSSGRVSKVIKYATDVTEKAKFNAEQKSVMEAIDRSQEIIEFEPDGTIIRANENFLSVVGYSLEEIRGKHHSMFAPADYAQSQEYKQLWSSLRAGGVSSRAILPRWKRRCGCLD
jgi:methyl-accepting chemotaxis protein